MKAESGISVRLRQRHQRVHQQRVHQPARQLHQLAPVVVRQPAHLHQQVRQQRYKQKKGSL